MLANLKEVSDVFASIGLRYFPTDVDAQKFPATAGADWYSGALFGFTGIEPSEDMRSCFPDDQRLDSFIKRMYK